MAAISESGNSSGSSDRSLELVEIDTAQIAANPRQPRKEFDEDSLRELAASIDEVGLLQPLLVRVADSAAGFGYELIAGERRLRAVRSLGWVKVPAIIRATGDDELLRTALLENLQRAALNPLEEAAAYEQLIVDFGISHSELAARVGRSRPAITNTIRLLRLPAAVQRRVSAGVLSQGHARALLGLGTAAQMEDLARRIVAEGLSVRSVEEIVLLGSQKGPGKRIRKPRKTGSTLGLESFADTLSDHLDTGVQVTMGAKKGKVAIDFAGVEDLERILDLLVPRGS